MTKFALKFGVCDSRLFVGDSKCRTQRKLLLAVYYIVLLGRASLMVASLPPPEVEPRHVEEAAPPVAERNLKKSRTTAFGTGSRTIRKGQAILLCKPAMVTVTSVLLSIIEMSCELLNQ